MKHGPEQSVSALLLPTSRTADSPVQMESMPTSLKTFGQKALFPVTSWTLLAGWCLASIKALLITVTSAGFEYGGGDPLYVIRLDPENARVIVGPREALLENEVRLREVGGLAKIRYRMPDWKSG